MKRLSSFFAISRETYRKGSCGFFGYSISRYLHIHLSSYLHAFTVVVIPAGTGGIVVLGIRFSGFRPTATNFNRSSQNLTGRRVL